MWNWKFGGIALALLGAVLAWHFWGAGRPQAPASPAALSSAPANSEPALKPDTGGSHPGLTYTEAVRIFSSQRIQFDADCVATPAYIVLRNGTEVMFDNRYGSKRYIRLDGISYLLRPYDFRVLKLSSANPPHTVAVDCASGRNNARIVLN